MRKGKGSMDCLGQKIEVYTEVYTDEINVGTPPEERKPLKNKVTVAVEEQHAKERTAGSKAK